MILSPTQVGEMNEKACKKTLEARASEKDLVKKLTNAEWENKKSDIIDKANKIIKEQTKRKKVITEYKYSQFYEVYWEVFYKILSDKKVKKLILDVFQDNTQAMFSEWNIKRFRMYEHDQSSIFSKNITINIGEPLHNYGTLRLFLSISITLSFPEDALTPGQLPD